MFFVYLTFDTETEFVMQIEYCKLAKNLFYAFHSSVSGVPFGLFTITI